MTQCFLMIRYQVDRHLTLDTVDRYLTKATVLERSSAGIHHISPNVLERDNEFHC